jgi:hypothetical protein
MNNLFYIYFIFVNFFIFLTTRPTKQTPIKATNSNVNKVNNNKVNNNKVNNNVVKNKKNTLKNNKKVGASAKKDNNQKNIKKGGQIKKRGPIKKAGMANSGGGGGNSGVQATSASNIPSNQNTNSILTKDDIKFLQTIGITETVDLSILNKQLDEKNKVIMKELDAKEKEIQTDPSKKDAIEKEILQLGPKIENISTIIAKINEYTNKINENNQ